MAVAPALALALLLSSAQAEDDHWALADAGWAVKLPAGWEVPSGGWSDWSLKARHKETGQIVAIKKFKESDEDEQVRKTALREVRILKQLKHDNIVNLIEVFRRKSKLHLVFEYVERTILEDLERNPDGLDPVETKKCLWQLLRSIDYCHAPAGRPIARKRLSPRLSTRYCLLRFKRLMKRRQHALLMALRF